MTAVIYARYSSDNQREESIEGQIRECTDYAEKNGVHLISVMEPIAEGSQGILVETLLEGMAEYYSAELSEKVIRGQTENALKGKCTGGTGTIGYKIDEEKFYHLDPLTAPLVLEAFQRYDNGDKMVEIVNFLNDKGVRNMQGGKMTHSSVNTMLKNRRYIGELSFRDVVVPDAIPAIVPKDLFDRVQKRMDKNKRAPACGKADEEYLLTTKLFCGKCGALMFGESGTSATGRTCYYYKCADVKRRKGCNKRPGQGRTLCPGLSARCGGPSALHLALHEVAHHLVQLAHGVLGTLGDFAGGAAHLALARVGGHDAGGAQCGTGGHTDQERGGGACVFVFHRRHSLRIKIFGLRG